MLWSNFLHIYQPYNQQLDILERIVNESYRPLLAGFKKNRKAKLTLNINGGLVELLVNQGYDDIIDDLKFLAQRGQIEFTASAMYHPFLPLLPEEEIKRQIDLNNQINQKYLGPAYQPKGFFSPELAYSHKLAKIVAERGYQWMIAEELASQEKQNFKKIYSIKDDPILKIIFRNKKISVLILSAIIRNSKSFLEELADDIKRDCYLLTVMDGETFGHHRPGLEKTLFEIYQEIPFKNVLVSELVDKFSTRQKIEVRECAWSSQEQDFWLDKEKNIVKANPFLLWQDPSNPIHRLQWEFVYFVIDLVKKIDQCQPNYSKIREDLDRSLQSDQFWWASAKPWWSLEMIEQGSFALREIVFSLPDLIVEDKERAQDYYRQIVDLAFDFQRSGCIRRAYQENLGTVGQKPYQQRVMAGQFNAMILEFEDEMNKDIKAEEFEKAIKWRDAIYKLKNGMDIYDVLHVIDDLRISRNLPSLKDFWEYSPEEFSAFSKKHFLDFKEEEFISRQPEQLFSEIKDVFAKKKKGEHPLGFFQDQYNNFYLGEFPSVKIKFNLKDGWNSFSQINLEGATTIQHPHQLIYQLKDKNKLKIVFTPHSLLGNFFNYLKEKDKLKGKYLKIALISNTLGWAPQFFQKDKSGQLSVEIPYLKDKTFYKFKITGWQEKETITVKKDTKIAQLVMAVLGKIDYLIQKLIYYLEKKK